MDGVGLGPNDPTSNPFASANTQNLQKLLGGQKLVADSLNNGNQLLKTDLATLLGLDARLGVDGSPQSATGQATILTGINIPEILGYHYGPKPNPFIHNHLKNSTLFLELKRKGYRIALLNAYPDSYFEAISTGRRLPGAVAMAAIEAGIALKTTRDLFAGKAISADFTGQGWRDRLNIPNTPILSFSKAGERLAQLSQDHDFSFFEYWISDYAGHRSNMEHSIQVVENFDAMLGGLISAWDFKHGLIFITSDHGNLEDTISRKHTHNNVPGLIIGSPLLREQFEQSIINLTDITPAILKMFEQNKFNNI